MLVYESLSAAELEAIQAWIELYGDPDGCETTLRASLDYILRFWDKNKEDLFRMFSGKTILTKDITVNKALEEMEADISTMLYDGAGHTFFRSFDHWRYGLISWDLTCNLSGLMSSEALAQNIYTGSSFSIPVDDKHSIEVSNGCKLSRVLGKIAKTFNIEGYEEFRIAHSQCLNQKTLKGQLCLSIHPLDYMTMSDNECGWESCMSWRQPGDYRLGTIEMMNSPCVVVAYLKASEDMHICDDIYWNNKKWRQLFIVTPDMVSGIRQYPYANDEVSGICLKWLRNLAEDTMHWGPYCDTAVSICNNRNNTFAELDVNESYYVEVYTRHMYNDYSCNQTAFISKNFPTNYSLCTSGETECIRCGRDISDYDECDIDTSALSCEDCDYICRCYECGERISIDESIETPDGHRVCSCCYDEYYHTCAMCGETTRDSYQVYLATDDETLTSYSIDVCPDCVNSDKFIELFGKMQTVTARHRWWGQEAVLLENLTLEGLDYFDVWLAEDYEKFKSQIEARVKDKT